MAYVPAIVFAGGVVRHVATRFEDDFALDPAAVEAAITPRTKALFLGYPCNPTGAVLPDEVQDGSREIAVRHDLLVYSDEIYDRLAYGTYRHRAMSALPGMRERTILMGGFSKAYAMTGWRVGYVAAPAASSRACSRSTSTGSCRRRRWPRTRRSPRVIEGEPEVERMLAEYDRRRRLIVDGLNAIGLETFEPRGAFYAFPRIGSTGLDRRRVHRTAADARSTSRSCPGARSGRRASGTSGCATRPRTSARGGARRIGRFVERVAPRTGGGRRRPSSSADHRLRVARRRLVTWSAAISADRSRVAKSTRRLRRCTTSIDMDSVAGVAVIDLRPASKA